MASRGSPLLEVTFHRSLLRTLIEHSVVYSAENPSRATQIGRSDTPTNITPAASRRLSSRVRGSGDPVASRHGLLAAARHAQRPRSLGTQKGSKTPLEQHGYYSAPLSFGTLAKISKRGKSPGIRENVAALAERGGRGAPDFPRFNQAELSGGRVRTPGDAAQQMNKLAESRVWPTIEHSRT